jgi:ATP-dependent helicase/nuclease subunit B
MRSFLEETIETLIKEHEDISQLTIILPSKRAGGFLKNYLRKATKKTIFAPEIISIEEFVEKLSGLTIIDPSNLLFKSYEAYRQNKIILEKESFESYSSWIQTLLNDFNEIDRYLVDTDAFFSYLGSVKSMEYWNVKNEQTELIQNYITFWESLPEFYTTLKNLLLRDGLGYQGMVYRKASEELEYYIQNHANKQHVFVGFNALNNAEQHIIQELLETGNSRIFWDMDAFFHNDNEHSASHFLRQYRKNWNFYTTNPFPDLPNNFTGEKKIRFAEIQKSTGQAKYVGQLLKSFTPEELNETAVVLADEALLVPLLYSLPQNIGTVNITMGVPLKSFPTTLFFNQLLFIHQSDTKTIYHKDLIKQLSHPVASSLLQEPHTILSEITAQNLTHIDRDHLFSLAADTDKNMVKTLFENWKDNANKALDTCLVLLNHLHENNNSHQIDKILYYELYGIFKALRSLSEQYAHLKSVKTVYSLFSELIATTTLDFKGDAYEGLQIMGVLETRVLDFRNVIMTSVNEGVLPSGKSNASFITYDLKKEFGLPLYTEKDAIYTYHFYRLLQRAQNVSLLFNNFTEGLNTGERSRFLLQLEVENLPNHTITKEVVSPGIQLYTPQLKQVEKTEEVLERLRRIASDGFSPSALTSYIRNPVDFYQKKVLELKELEEVEETVDFNTLGTIVHDTLQEFYQPLEGSFLNLETLQKLQNNIENEVTEQFKKTFRSGNFTTGKNLLIFEVAKRYVANLLQLEIDELKSGNSIKILKIESDLKIPLSIAQLSFPVFLKGKVDRVDEYNGTLRIIDYKTGSVKQSDLEIVDWELLNSDYKYSKAFQVLAYSLMINDEIPLNDAHAGIISFKNLNNGFLKFATKPSPRGKKDYLISSEVLTLFKYELERLIVEICDPEQPFTEKEIN